MAEGVDYAGDRPSPSCLYSKGKRFAVRYFGPGGSWKHATANEVKALHAAGLTVVANAEGAQRDPMQGRTMGKAHAIAANAATKAVGMPSGRPIYFSVDFDAQPHDMGAVANYFRGCADIIGLARVGAYAGYAVIEYLHSQKLASWFWQTYAWSHGNWSRFNHIEQYRNGQTVCGADVDLCRSKVVDFGQWPAPKESVGPAPAPPPDSTVDVGWDFTTHVDALADVMGDVGALLTQTGRAVDGLG